ncbi:MAG: SDR family NAD(P)-dependent oxidoreductase [Nocardioides sp.]|uniref:SDR family NAD(P)-dependent oxidoreductase n=1 Tax=Nocardioides sp. TaxID=35761 RepID=UPI0023945668|nr:SDR family NAD(P)-dependent oxidoreductase [Nocardioides sp.]MDE0774846.1 SDR family NAD(P)-dependent oxidoreductase [Nocardioides sp.]
MSESTSGQTMTGRTVLVTGASDGIGAETAKALAGRGATVHVTGRSAEKLRPVADAVGTEPLVADFSRLDDVRRLAEQVGERVEHLDVLLNNAGGTFSPRHVTHDGHEPNFQVNHLAPFLLTNLLRPRLAAAGSSLVVNTSSIGNLMGKVVLDDLDHERRRALEFPAYGTGKLMNIVFTRGISQRWSGDGIVSVAVHPGPVGSSFGRDSWLVGLLYRSPLKRLATISVPDGAAPLSHAGRARAGPGPGRSLLQPLQPEGPREQAGPRPDDHRRPVGTVGGAGRTDHMTGSRSHDVGSCHTRLWLRGVKGYAD